MGVEGGERGQGTAHYKFYGWLFERPWPRAILGWRKKITIAIARLHAHHTSAITTSCYFMVDTHILFLQLRHKYLYRRF